MAAHPHHNSFYSAGGQLVLRCSDDGQLVQSQRWVGSVRLWETTKATVFSSWFKQKNVFEAN